MALVALAVAAMPLMPVKGYSPQAAADRAARHAAGHLARLSYAADGPTTAANAAERLQLIAAWERDFLLVSGIMGQPNVTDSNPPRPDKGVLMRFELLLRVPESRLPRLWHVVVEYRANFTAARPYEVPRKAPAVALDADLRCVDPTALHAPWPSRLKDVPHVRLHARAPLAEGGSAGAGAVGLSALLTPDEAIPSRAARRAAANYSDIGRSAGAPTVHGKAAANGTRSSSGGGGRVGVLGVLASMLCFSSGRAER